MPASDRRLRWRFRRYASLLLEAAAHALVAFLSGIVGRDADLWVFGAREGEAFGDNAKYLFLHVAATRPGIRVVWVSRDRDAVRALRTRGYEAYHLFSPRGVLLQFRAGVVFLTHNFKDVNRWAVGGATTVVLWHGIALKRISWDAELAELPPIVRSASRYLYRRYDRVTLTGRGTLDSFVSGFRLPPSRFVVTGYPRTDALFDSVPDADVGVATGTLADLRRLSAEHDVLLYLPTFRENPAERASERIDLDALDRLLDAHDAYLAVKLHPDERLERDLDEYPRILRIPSWSDVYPMLPHADALVTDYSSIYFEYLLLDRPVVFYPYDLPSYRSERGFYYAYDEVTPGPVASDFDGLLAAIERTLAGDDPYETERCAVRRRFFDHPAGGRAAAVFDAVAALME
ncbi:CDP-glycerol glycerophosphotransferase family protein [Halegenticoccus tardaugens]|uniref:CDP-glycerol glycerophosphotransferase family protein n=1 Tax=Halegenticoccus tardaugens TaxID=2071624 RepID=UPI0013E91473|nr:CDP-glycerol glycerophosphotransferase family protein [Halegenticoccus tardaugens]